MDVVEQAVAALALAVLACDSARAFAVLYLFCSTAYLTATVVHLLIYLNRLHRMPLLTYAWLLQFASLNVCHTRKDNLYPTLLHV